MDPSSKEKPKLLTRPDSRPSELTIMLWVLHGAGFEPMAPTVSLYGPKRRAIPRKG